MSKKTNDDSCQAESTYASCQHIKFVAEKIETETGLEIRHSQLIPPGRHLLFGAIVVNSTTRVQEAAS